MSLLPKPSLLHAFQMAIYDQEMPNDFVFSRGRRAISDKDYLLDASVMSGGHVLRFEVRDATVVEYVTEFDKIIPSAGLITSFSCPQERDYEHRFPVHAVIPPHAETQAARRVRASASPVTVVYMTSVQTETLPESLYSSTFRELVDFGRQGGALAHLWRDGTGDCLSMVDIQRCSGQAHAQTYHMMAQGGVVLRTQTIFEIG
jgi:hypothetical protein